MKEYLLRVNNDLHNTIEINGVPHEIEHVRFARSINPRPLSAIIADMESQLNPDEICCNCGGCLFEYETVFCGEDVFCSDACEWEYLSNA